MITTIQIRCPSARETGLLPDNDPTTLWHWYSPANDGGYSTTLVISDSPRRDKFTNSCPFLRKLV